MAIHAFRLRGLMFALAVVAILSAGVAGALGPEAQGIITFGGLLLLLSVLALCGIIMASLTMGIWVVLFASLGRLAAFLTGLIRRPAWRGRP